MDISYVTNGAGWTAHEDKFLLEKLIEGWTARRIGLSLNRTKNSVLGRTYRLGYAKHKPELETTEHTRKCLCCSRNFVFTENYRLCNPCRNIANRSMF